MLLDKNLTFTENGATGNTGTRVVGDVIDLGTPARDIGAGQPVFLNIRVRTGITVASSTGTIRYQLVSASDDAITSSVVVHAQTGDLTTSTTAIAAGTEIANIAIPAGTSYGRYLAVREVVGTTNTNAGAVSAFLSKQQPAYTAYDGVQ